MPDTKLIFHFDITNIRKKIRDNSLSGIFVIPTIYIIILIYCFNYILNNQITRNQNQKNYIDNSFISKSLLQIQCLKINNLKIIE
jgi:hypothetical protein